MTARYATEVWLALEDACALTGWKPRHLRRVSSDWPTRDSESRGPNGKKEREYPLSSLPAEARLKYAQNGGGAAERFHLTRVETLPLFASSPEPIPDAVRLIVPEELADQAAARYAAIEPLLDFRKRTNGARPTIRLADGKVVNTMNDLAKYLAAQQKLPTSSSTLYRWLSRFVHSGYAALADTPRKDKDQSRFFTKRPAAALYLQNKFLKEGLSIQMAWEAVVREWPKLSGAPRSKRNMPPCYDTARNFLNALPQDIKTLARRGPEALAREGTPHIIRGPVPVMDWWVLDHRVFDVFVRNTLFGHLEPNQKYRLWFTAIADWGSRKWVGFCFAPTPSSRTINSALRMAAADYGFPKNFYWDNGKDFRSVAGALEEMSETRGEDAKHLLERYAVGITHALPRRPRSKPIESWFARVSKRFDPCWRPAYAGNRPENCPEDCRAAQKQHDEFLKGKRPDSPLPTDAEFIAAAMQFFAEENATPREALDDRTPDQVFDEQYPAASRQPAGPRMLDILFSERTLLTVQAGGCVQTRGVRYEPTIESLGPLALRHGQKILLLRDAYRLECATAVDPETHQLVGDMVWQDFVAQCPGGHVTRDAIQAGVRKQRAWTRSCNDYVNLLSAIARSQGWKTEREGWLERAGVRTGTDDRPALPAAIVPGARRTAELPRASELDSPFVDDAVREYNRVTEEEEAKKGSE